MTLRFDTHHQSPSSLSFSAEPRSPSQQGKGEHFLNVAATESEPSFFPETKPGLTVGFHLLLVKLLEKVLCSPLWIGAWHHAFEIGQQFL